MNVLIVDEDQKFANLLLAEFKKSSKITNVSIVKSIDDVYFSNYENADNNIVKEDIVLYDLTIVNIDLLKDNINNMCLLRSKDYIGLSSISKNINKYINSSLFLRILKMPISIKDFISYLNNYYNLFDNNSKITEQENFLDKLSCLGFNISHCGTHYLAEGISIALNNNLHDISEIYNELSKKYFTKPSSIKWSIYNSVNWACNGDYNKKMEKYFKIYDGRKPTPKFIIDFFTSLSRYHNVI